MRALLDTDEIRIESWLSEVEDRSLANDVLDGLTKPFKEIPPKHFYDTRGSELFERICALPEYYPTRTERSILASARRGDRRRDRRDRARRAGLRRGRQGADPARRDGAAGTLERYVPFDVSEQVVRDAARAARRGVRRPARPRRGRRLRAPPRPRAADRGGAAHRGASSAARSATSRPARGGASCARSRALLGPDDRLLLGTDLVKDPAVIEAAYDDTAGVTAEFNRNVLHVHQPRARRRLRPRGVRARRVLRPPARVGRDAPARAARRAACMIERSRPARRLRRRRGAAHRDQREVHARAAGRDFGRPASSSRGWYTDPDELFALSLARRAPISFRPMQIDGSAALIAGGASGLGEATARELHARGATVVIADLNADRGQALVDELGASVSFVRAM